MLWFVLSILVVTTLYVLIVLYLFLKEKTPNSSHTGELFNSLGEKYPTKEAVYEAEKRLEADPNNIELRIEILTTRTFIRNLYDTQTFEHAFWFLEHRPLLDFTFIESKMSMAGLDETGLNRVRELWRKYIEESGNDPFYIRAAAYHLVSLDKETSKEYWKMLLAISPFSNNSLEKLATESAWNLLRDESTKHPNQELQESLTYYKKLMSNRWSEEASTRLEQLRWKYKFLIPVWFCILFLRVIGTFYKESNPWHDHYDVAEFGMVAYRFGDFQTARKCADQFLKLQPEAQKGHNYPPIYSTGFSLAAIMAYLDGDMERFKKCLDYKVNDSVNEEYLFPHEDDYILSFLLQIERKDLVIEYILRRAGVSDVNDPKVKASIDFINTGAMIRSKDYYTWIRAHYEKNEK